MLVRIFSGADPAATAQRPTAQLRRRTDHTILYFLTVHDLVGLLDRRTALTAHRTPLQQANELLVQISYTVRACLRCFVSA